MIVRAALLVALAAPVAAQTIGPATTGGTRIERTCIDVRIGDAQAYDCLNQVLRQSVPPPAGYTVPYRSDSPANAVGTYNEAGTRMMLGNNFGRSVFPQRPEGYQGGRSPLAANGFAGVPAAGAARSPHQGLSNLGARAGGMGGMAMPGAGAVRSPYQGLPRPAR